MTKKSTFAPADRYTLQEKLDVYVSIKERAGEHCPLRAVAKDTGIRETIVRFIVDLLIEWGYIKKEILIDMGPHYRRYTYRLTDKDYEKDRYEDKSFYKYPELVVPEHAAVYDHYTFYEDIRKEKEAKQLEKERKAAEKAAKKKGYTQI